MARFGVGVYTPNVSTSFPTTENPISESGRWVNNGTLWTKVQVSGALAFGQQDNSGGFDDSFTHLASSFPSDQWGEGTIHKGSTSGLMEVEVLLRANSSSSSATFYECNLAHDGAYTEIVRWEGGLGSFTYLSQPGSVGFTPADGDKFYAQIKGSVITVKVWRVAIGSYTTVNSYDTASDSKIYRVGKPGFAFYRSGGAASNTYCYSNFQYGIL